MPIFCYELLSSCTRCGGVLHCFSIVIFAMWWYFYLFWWGLLPRSVQTEWNRIFSTHWTWVKWFFWVKEKPSASLSFFLSQFLGTVWLSRASLCWLENPPFILCPGTSFFFRALWPYTQSTLVHFLATHIVLWVQPRMIPCLCSTCNMFYALILPSRYICWRSGSLMFCFILILFS